jgi:hypothetical protein
MASLVQGMSLTSPVKPVMAGIGVLTVAAVTASSSPLIVLISGGVCIFIFALLWRVDEPPILLIPAVAQFVAIALKPLTTAFTNGSLQDLSEFGGELEPAALFGLAGIAVLVLGLRIGAGTAPARSNHRVIDDWSFNSIFALAMGAIVLGHALDFVAAKYAGLQQIMLSLSGIKWAGLFVLAYWTLCRRRDLRWLVVVVLIEIVMGMTGFFAGFRLVLFVLLGAAIAAHTSLGARGIILLTMGAVLTIVLAVFWSSIKEDYRQFLNQGTGEQVVLQPVDERLSYLATEALDFDGRRFEYGFERLLERVSYIDFLAVTMERVPNVLPYENGSHLGAAIWHVVTPRLLFPDKAELPSDTIMTAYYTGLEQALWATASTSISIGYLGELYIDFTIWGALLAVFSLGLAYGRCYRAIRNYPYVPEFINYGLCMMIALAFASFETSLIRLIGTLGTTVTAALVLQRMIWPAILSSGVVNFPNTVCTSE